jgi:glycyl-tRNA synthetase beta chain
MTKDALLEIGCEELPASFIPIGMRQLKAFAEQSLSEHKLSFVSVAAYGTPRRLAVLITGLAEKSEDQKKVVTGPPAAAAKDAQGQWTPAAIGFAKKHGLKPAELLIEKDRLSAALHLKGLPARKLLATLFPDWIRRLEFPKSMVWEPSHFRFPRPIRWLAAVYGGDAVPVSVAGVRAGKWTYGLPLHGERKIALAQPGKYVALLKNQCVLVEPEARQEAIRKLAEQAVKRVHGHVIMPPRLLEQVANLVEHPVAILGGFDAAYLNLPAEVLITCLEHHQKFFPVAASATGRKLLAQFVGIRNGMSVHQEVVREGYERVLAARLSDARFFYDQDRQAPLASRVEALKGVVFQEKLGTLHDKAERVASLIRTLCARIPGAAVWQAAAEQAALLCKADLTTAMVGEFPELQGVMARLYAQAEGLDAGLAQALEEHYWPVTLTGKLPESDLAALVALADKIDTLAGDFAIGLIPSGSADPYGLRRAAVGVLRILEERRWPIEAEALVREALARYPEAIREGRPGTEKDLTQFLKQRLSALLEERGFRFDEVEAVLAAGIGSVADAVARLEALHELRARKEFEPLSIAFKRGMNIVRQAAKAAPVARDAAPAPVDSALLQEPCEQLLFQALEQAGAEVSRHLEARAYRQALESMVPLREPLDGFFNGVLVMAEDAGLRRNRLALMDRLVGIFSTLADFSKLQQ